MWKKLNVDMAEEWLMLSNEILNPEALMLKASATTDHYFHRAGVV